MYLRNFLLIISLLLGILYNNFQVCDAAYEPEILDDVSGVGWSIKAKNVNSIIEVNKPDMIELYHKDNGELYIKFLKAGDFYLTETFVSELDGKTYKNVTFMHIIDKLTMEDVKHRTNAFRLAVKMLRLINDERAKVGVAPLEWSDELMQAGAIRAKEISENFSHVRPDGTSFKSIIKDENCYMAENIARGQSKVIEVLPVWLNSDEHRANILNPKFKKFGLGYYYDDNKFPVFHFWSQLFSS